MMRTPSALLFSLALLTPQFSSANPQKLDDQAVAWMQQQDGNIQLYFARKQSGQWSETIPLTHAGVHVTPTLVTHNDHSWIAWVERKGQSGNVLHIAHVVAGKVEEKSIIPTDHGRVFSPSISADKKGRVWLTWSAFDGADEDIYAIWFDDGASGPVERVHADNQVPDVLPTIRVTDAIPAIHFERMDHSGNASEIVVQYKAGRWVELPKSEKGVGVQWSEVASQRQTYKQNWPGALPPSVEAFNGAVIYHADDGEIRLVGDS